MKGIIALDIDGTLTVDHHRLEFPVKNYLENLIEEKWQVILLTGRTFAFSKPILKCIEKEFYCSFQNGASILTFPNEKLIKKDYLPFKNVFEVEKIFKKYGLGMLIESGIENKDCCYFRWNDFPVSMHDYLRYRISISPERWIEVDDFEKIDLKAIPVIKYFAQQDAAYSIAKEIEALCGMEVRVTVIHDPFNPGSFLAHVNQKAASKGQALRYLINHRKLPVIVAGDDYNDVEMLKVGDIKIVMQDAPQEVLQIADIIAPLASDCGIIQGLEKAIQKIKTNY